MSFDYASLEVIATELIGEFGFASTLTTTLSQGVTSQRTPKIVLVEQVKGTASDFGDSGIVSGDWLLLMESAGVPLKADVLRYGSEKLTVVFAEPIKPGNVVLAYKVWARIA